MNETVCCRYRILHVHFIQYLQASSRLAQSWYSLSPGTIKKSLTSYPNALVSWLTISAISENELSVHAVSWNSIWQCEDQHHNCLCQGSSILTVTLNLVPHSDVDYQMHPTCLEELPSHIKGQMGPIKFTIAPTQASLFSHPQCTSCRPLIHHPLGCQELQTF